MIWGGCKSVVFGDFGGDGLGRFTCWLGMDMEMSRQELSLYETRVYLVVLCR